MSEQSDSPPVMDTRLAVVSADALHRLEPFLAKHEDCIWHYRAKLWGWRVEPCAEGGVLVIATNGTVAGVIHDPTGRASEPVTIMASEALRKAVAPPVPVTVYYPGDYDEEELPARYQPHTVFAHGLFVSVYDEETCTREDRKNLDEGEGRSLFVETAEEGNIHAGGYRLAAEYVPWRQPFGNWRIRATTGSHQRIDPRLFNAFRRIGQGTLEMYFPDGDFSPVLVTSTDAPDFVGLIMRGNRQVRPAPPPAFPPWFVPEPAPAAAEAAA